MPVPDRRLDAPVLEQALALEPFARLLDEAVHVLDGHTQVVLVHLAELARGLGEGLAEGPQGRDLGFVLREDAVRDDLRFEEVLEEAS